MSTSAAPVPAGWKRKVFLSVLAVLFPPLGLFLAGVELGYRRYYFGAVLLSLTFFPLALLVLLSLLFG
jgi:hypothetical protein